MERDDFGNLMGSKAIFLSDAGLALVDVEDRKCTGSSTNHKVRLILDDYLKHCIQLNFRLRILEDRELLEAVFNVPKGYFSILSA